MEGKTTPPANVAGQFGNTTYTKIFVGGLAWETKRDTMRKYFEQFGDILEAVVICDKNTGRSKGYGFVTFREPEAAMRACIDPTPVIDRRRANCNLASLGLQRSKPTTPLQGGSRSTRVMKAFQAGGGLQGGGGGGMGTAFPSPATLPNYAIQQGSMPCNLYGYSPYSEYSYPTSYYNFYGGAAAQYPLYGGATTGLVAGTTSYYPYFELGQGTTGTGFGFGMQYPQMFQYSTSTVGATGFVAQLYDGTMPPLAPTSMAQAGMNMALTAPSLPSPTAYRYRLIPTHLSATTAPEQPWLNHGSILTSNYSSFLV